MNKNITPLILCASILILPNVSHALRCGTKLANVGDLKHEVLLACGRPNSKETIGYIDKVQNGDRIKVLKLEEWILEKSNKYYSLVFEGNRLITIERAGDK